MVQSSAPTVEAYLAELPDDRRDTVAAVRQTVLDHLPEGYQERMAWGMISYEVPLERYPETYNGQPLMYAALAAQKRGFTLYLMNEYADGSPALREGFERAGKKLDMGKSCVRFKRLDDLPLDVIGDAIARTPVDAFIELYEASRSKRKK
jgi:hypothetical protein